MQKPIKIVLTVSIFFCILFTAGAGFQNVLTKIHQEEGDQALGPFALATEYSVYAIMNIFVGRLRNTSEKWRIALSSLSHCLYYLSGFMISGTPTWVKYTVTGLGAFCSGIGSSILWISLGSYIHKVAHIFGMLGDKGKYYGIFHLLFSSSSVFGGLIVTFALHKLSHPLYFALISSVSFLAFLFGVVFIEDLKKFQNSHQQSSILTQAERKQGLGDSQKVGLQNQTIWETAKRSFSFYSRMRYALGLIAISGINNAIPSSTMLRLLPKYGDQKTDELYAGICLLIYGTGQVVAGYFAGKLCDKYRIKPTLFGALSLFCFSCVSFIIGWYVRQFWCAGLCCLIWGLNKITMGTSLMVVCSRLFGGHPQTFALLQQFNSVIFITYQIFIILSDNSLPVSYLMCFVIVMCVPAFYGLCKLPPERQQELQDSLINNQEQENCYSPQTQ